VQDLLQRVEDLRAVAQRLAQRRRADRQDHEFLDVEAVVGVRAAVDDVHHRHRHHRLALAPEGWRRAAEQRLPGLVGRGMRIGERHRQQRVGAQPRLVVGAVEFDHARIEAGLIARLAADERLAQQRVDVVDRRVTPLP
jgi:hypothetical protein